jgi:membrane-bound serine protease (ClpP class)
MIKFIIRSVILVFTILLSSTGFANKTDSSTVYIFEIKDEISDPIWHNMQNALEESRAINADYFVIDMNTYGGLVLIADSIRTAILRLDIPVYILINNNAASAGALISIACDKIYMMPGSTIGAATVVTETGEKAIDKYQSYMRSKMRATAEETGRNPEIAEAMVDQDIAIDGVISEGKLLTFTVSEAIENGFCEKEVDGIKDLLKDNNLENATIVKYVPTKVDTLIGWLINPAISGILIMIMMGGIYFELQSPGIGFPIAAAAIAATLFFAPLYLEGLAENWEIILFVVGIILLVAEVFFIPGTGIAGVLGVTFVITGLTLSMVENVRFDFTMVNFDGLLMSFSVVLFSIFAMAILTLIMLPKMLDSGKLKALVLTSSQKVNDGYVGIDQSIQVLIGQNGIAFSDLRPAGKVLINNNHYDATSLGSYILKDEKVEVTGTEGPQLLVRKI